MATSQLERQTQQTDTWTTVFPAEQNTLLESEVFVKKLLVVGLSSITYLRTIFPESSYCDQNLDGVKLKVLVDNTYCCSSNKVIDWLRSCFDALEKKYLRQLTFAILNKKNLQEAYETYTYKFRYTNEGPVISGPGTPNSAAVGRNVRQATAKMLHTLILLTQNMGILPKTVCLSMKLGYYDEVTPSDYEPPSFSPIADGSYTFKSKPVTIKVGNVATRYHSTKMYVCVEKTAYPGEDDGSPVEIQAIEDPPPAEEELQAPAEECNNVVRSFGKQSGRQHFSKQSSGSSQRARSNTPFRPRHQSPGGDHLVPTQSTVLYSPNDNNDKNNNTASHMQNGTPTQSRQTMDVDEEETQEESSGEAQSSGNGTWSEDYPVRCPCGVHSDQGLMILCDICQRWQHGACFNVLEASEVKASHVCEQCANAAHPCTDPTLLQQQSEAQVVDLCLFRRALVLLQQMKGNVSAAGLAQQLGVDISVGTHLQRELLKEKILHMKKKNRYVNRTKLLSEAFPRYLHAIKDTQNNTEDTIDLMSPTQKSIASGCGYDSNVTPDLHNTSLNPASLPSGRLTNTRGQANGNESLNTVLEDESLDIMNITEDVPISTQAVNVTSQAETHYEPSSKVVETYSEALATAGNTLLLLDSPSEPSQQTKKRFSTSMPLHSGMDVDEGSAEFMGNEESLTSSRPPPSLPAEKRKLSLGTRQRGRGKGRGMGKQSGRRKTMNLNVPDDSLSQDSAFILPSSTSQNSQALSKKRKTRK